MYFHRCQALVEAAEAAHAELTQQAQDPSGVIRGSLPVDFAVDRITVIIAEFIRLYPRITFDLDLSPRQSDLIAEPVDFVVRIGRPSEGGLIQRKLTEVSIGLFASPDYIAEHGLPLHPQDLQQHNVLSILGRPLRFLADVPETRPNSPVLVNNVSWLRRFALAGMGIAALSSDMARPEVVRSALLPILPDWHLPKVEVYVLTESRLLPARVRLFLDYLIANLDAA